MRTLILNSKQIDQAVKLLQQNQVVAFPTETVYGLGGNALKALAVKKIFKAKKRPYSDPLIVHCSSLEMAESVAYFTEQAKLLAKKFWPGPLTLVLKKKKNIPFLVTAGKKTVGVRIPSHPVALKLIHKANFPIAAPSANTFTKISPTNAKHVLEDLDGKISAVIQASNSKIGVESTVVDLSSKLPNILRPGGLSFAELKKVLPKLKNFSGQASKKSPGQYKFHYSPKAKVVLVKTLKEILKYENQNTNFKSGVLAFSHWLPSLKNLKIFKFNWGQERNHKQLAQRLYRGLRELDAKGVKTIYCPLPKDKDLGSAILNRLKKASGV